MKNQWIELDEVSNYFISNKGIVRDNKFIYLNIASTNRGDIVYLPINGEAVIYLIDDLVEKYFGEVITVEPKSSSFTSRRRKRKCCNK